MAREPIGGCGSFTRPRGLVDRRPPPSAGAAPARPRGPGTSRPDDVDDPPPRVGARRSRPGRCRPSGRRRVGPASSADLAVGHDLARRAASCSTRVDGLLPRRHSHVPCPGVPTLTADRRRRPRRADRRAQGYTIVEDAIEPDLARRARPTSSHRLEVDLGIVPGDQRLRGQPDRPHLQPARARHGLRADPGAPERAAGRRGRARPRLPHLVAVVDRHRAGRDAAADPRRRPAHARSRSRTRRRCATRCGRSPTSPRRTAPPGSSPARTSPTARPTTARPTTRSRPRWPRGSVLVWHGSLWHGGGANTTDERRVGIAMNYCAGYIRQQENQQLGIPRDIAAGLRRRASSSSAATASTTGSSATSTSTTRSSCSKASAPTGWCGSDGHARDHRRRRAPPPGRGPVAALERLALLQRVGPRHRHLRDDPHRRARQRRPRHRRDDRLGRRRADLRLRPRARGDPARRLGRHDHRRPDLPDAPVGAGLGDAAGRRHDQGAPRVARSQPRDLLRRPPRRPASEGRGVGPLRAELSGHRRLRGAAATGSRSTASVSATTPGGSATGPASTSGTGSPASSPTAAPSTSSRSTPTTVRPPSTASCTDRRATST